MAPAAIHQALGNFVLVFDRLESIALGPVWGSCRGYILTLLSLDPIQTPHHGIYTLTRTLNYYFTMRSSILATLAIATCATAYPFMAEYNQLNDVQKRAVTEMAKKNLQPRGAVSYCKSLTLSFASTDLIQPRNTHTVAPRSTGSQEVKSVISKYQHLAMSTTNTRTRHLAPSEVLVQDSMPLPITDS